jgi:hypothetical protein
LLPVPKIAWSPLEATSTPSAMNALSAGDRSTATPGTDLDRGNCHAMIVPPDQLALRFSAATLFGPRAACHHWNQ